MKIPANKQWTQDNSGDTFGILGDTTNMAMDTLGKATLARKAVALRGSWASADFKYPLACHYYDNTHIVLTSDEVFEFDINSLIISAIGTAPAFFLGSDAVIFNGDYVASSGTTGTTLHSYNGSSWTQKVTGLTSNVPHPLDVSGSFLFLGNGNKVIRYTDTFAVNQTLTLPTEYRVTTIRVVNTYVYIGTKNMNGGNAKIFVWNGNGTDADYAVEVGAQWVFSLTPYQSTVAAITSQGQLGIVNGTTFQQLDALPVYYNPHATWQDSTGPVLNGKVFNRGMCTIGDTIYINVDGEVANGNVPEMKSGIWVYDPAIGLYHRATSSADRAVSDSSLTRTGNVITTSNNHLLQTGDAVQFTTVSGLTGIDNNVEYYVTVESPNSFKLSPSRKALQAGRYITLGGTPTSDKVVYAQNADNGAIDSTSGFIVPLTPEVTPLANFTTEILWGCRTEEKTGTALYTIQSFCDSLNVGQITTQRIYTDNIDQSWKEIYTFLDGLITDEEKVVVKVQTDYEPANKTLRGVWLSANQINNYNVDDFTAFEDIEVGFEIVITDKYGRGRTAHVTDISKSTNTVTLTLDEDLGTVNENVDFYYTTFKKIGEYTREHKDKEKLRISLGNIVSPWIVLKFELRGFETAINMIELSNGVHKQTN